MNELDFNKKKCIIFYIILWVVRSENIIIDKKLYN
jgi:hypothetical protein